eukprot:5270203-Alexandrium_andersonii.AAC.1
MTRDYGTRRVPSACRGGLSRGALVLANEAMASLRLAAKALERVGRLEAIADFAGTACPASRRWFLAEA